jgi:N-ethylmaleimide reductase
MTATVASQTLLSPVDLGDGLVLRNRVVMAPMTRARAGEERIPNALMAQYYAQRAEAGLIVTEATSISHQAIGWTQSPGIFTNAQTEGWKQVTQAVHAKGGKIFLQLWHCGRASHTSFHPDEGLPVSASALPIQGDIHTPFGKAPYEVPRPLELSEIQTIIEQYQHSAVRAREAGFDGVEVHGANGYLLDQFLQDISNHRTDAYGGSVDHRARFLLEVVEAVCNVWPAHRVGVRLSPNGNFNDMGDSNPHALFGYVAQQLNQFPLAYLHVMDGLGFGFHGNGEPLTLRHFRQWFHGPIMGNVGYTQASSEAAIASGDADMIAFGRPFISTPDLVTRFRHSIPLNPEAPMSTWYSHETEGYVDYPAMHVASV